MINLAKNIFRIFQQHKNFSKSTEDDNTWFLSDPEDFLTSFIQILSFNGSNILTGKDFTLNCAGTFLPTWSTQLYYVTNNLLAIAGPRYCNDNVTNLNNEGNNCISQVASKYTFVITFDLDGHTTPTATGEVKVSIQGQFSMDYYKNYLCIVTTSGARYGLFPLEDGHCKWTQLDDSKSLVYVLQEQKGGELVTVGIIADLGIGDVINFVCLLGGREYISLCDEDSPFYVLDLSNSTNPVMAGKP